MYTCDNQATFKNVARLEAEYFVFEMDFFEESVR